MKKKIALGIILGVLFLWLAVRNVSFEEVMRELRKAQWIYVIPAILIGLMSHFFRALRWKITLQGIKAINYWSLFSINAVGFLGIHIFPLRLGELVKPLLLKRKHGIRMSAGFGTVAVERVFDGMTLVLFLVISFLFASFNTDKIPFVGQSVHYLITGGVIIFGAAFVFLLMLVFAEELAIKIISKAASIFPERLSKKIIAMAKAFVSGLSSLPDIRKIVSIILLSLLIWLSAVAIMYLGLLAFNLELSWEASFMVLGIVSLGIMLPGPPGFVGNFQLFCQGALGLYGVSAATGLSYSIVVHAINMFCVFLLGFICLPSNFISYRAVLESKDKLGEKRGPD